MKKFLHMKAIVLVFLLLFFALLICASIHGLILAFSASILLGMFALLIEPLPLVFGMAYWIWGVDLAAKFIHWLS